jgi:hypothetical protein
MIIVLIFFVLDFMFWILTMLSAIVNRQSGAYVRPRYRETANGKREKLAQFRSSRFFPATGNEPEPQSLAIVKRQT